MRAFAIEHQLEQWVAGNSIHNGKKSDPQSECCPDFSCCKPELLAPLEVRKAFQAGDQATRSKFLMAFLGAMLSGTAVDVHIIDSDPTPSS